MTIKINRYKLSLLAVFFTVLNLSGCFSHWHGNLAKVVISFGGAGRSIVKSGAKYDPEAAGNLTLKHEIVFSNKRETITFKHEGTADFESYIAPGNWTVWVYSWLNDEIWAAGFEPDVKLQAGQENILPIEMYEAFVVKFDSQGGNEIPDQIARKGFPVVKPSDPKRGGLKFIGWYTDNDFTEPLYNFDENITRGFTLYAKWDIWWKWDSSIANGNDYDSKTNVEITYSNNTDCAVTVNEAVIGGGANDVEHNWASQVGCNYNATVGKKYIVTWKWNTNDEETFENVTIRYAQGEKRDGMDDYLYQLVPNGGKLTIPCDEKTEIWEFTMPGKCLMNFTFMIGADSGSFSIRDFKIEEISISGGITIGDWHWDVYNDSYNGGTSSINMYNNNGAITFFGNVTTDYDSRYAGWTAFPNDTMLLRLKKANSISFKVKGDGKTYKLILPTSDITDWSYYLITFTAPTTETIVTIYINRLISPGWGQSQITQFDQSKVTNVAWETNNEAEGPFNLTISDLTLNEGVNIPNIEMVSVPGGSFLMGNNNGDNTEKPSHTVTLTGFSMGKYEVTQAQYLAVMGTNPSISELVQGEAWEKCPVDNVSWYDAIEFCNKLSEMEGRTPYYSIDKKTTDLNNTSNEDTLKWTVTLNTNANGYRLPTEAQWEYAARGGNNSNSNYSYSGSNTINDVAWYKDNSSLTNHEVGKKQGNALGLHDMTGNVWEWCWDWSGSYPSSDQSDPVGPDSGSQRIDRGGSRSSTREEARTTCRGGNTANTKYGGCGFRLVLP